VLRAALLVSLMGPLLGSCGTSGTGADANQSVPSAARGKRVSIVVNSDCTSDSDGLCALSTPALKAQLDKNVSEGRFFAAVTNDRPDFKLTVVFTQMEKEEGFTIFNSDTFEAAAKFELADNTGKVVFSGKASGDSEKAEDAMRKLAANIAAKIKQ
jgi:hypothetical protein